MSSLTSGESGGLSMGNLMAPLMLTLLEKLLAQDVVTDQEEPQPTPVTIQATQPEQTEDDGVAVDSPQGKPIDGYITQRAHAGHIGLDFGAPQGTSVKATMDGEVIYAGWNNEGYGNLVIVENGPYKTYFAHLSEIEVKVGDRVQANSEVGLSGNTGNSTGPHLHYEVRKNNQQIDPASFTL
jgi:murein DD-endopeptidase MepM/ murein hydrolase activator NlpD